MTGTASATTSPPWSPQLAVPVRSPRTSIVLAELARQRRLERCRRRLKRLRRRQAWVRVRAWLYALSRWPFEAIRTQAAPDVLFSRNVPLVDTLRPASQRVCSPLP